MIFDFKDLYHKFTTAWFLKYYTIFINYCIIHTKGLDLLFLGVLFLCDNDVGIIGIGLPVDGFYDFKII